MRTTIILLSLLSLLSLPGCDSAEAPTPDGEPAPPAEGAPASDMRTLAIPGSGGAGAPTGSGPLVWTVPESWEEVQPDNTVRRAQYRLPGPDGDAECVVFYFGPGQGGDAESNARRWAGQFIQPDGRPSEEVMRIELLEETQIPVQLVEVTGTYNGGMTTTEESPGSMLLGGIAQGPDALWFFKVIGPEANVRSQRGAFVEMMRSLRQDG